MKRNIFSKFLYTVFHILLTLIVIIIVILPIWFYCLIACAINKDKTIYKEFAVVSGIMLRSLGVKLYINGKIPNGLEDFIVVANHINWLDALKISRLFNGIPGVVFLDKKMFKYPILGWFLRKVEAISIDGKTHTGIAHAYRQSFEVLKKRQKHLFIFPEGTRTLDGKMSQFKRGAFSLAIKTRTRIFPVGIAGAFEFSNKSTWLLNPGPVVICTGSIIDIDNICEDELSKITQAAISKCILKAEKIWETKL